jgi:hypothetical protein
MTMTKPTSRKASEETADAPQTPTTDARHPDTVADAGAQPPAYDPSESAVRAAEPKTVDRLDPAVYGFRAIEVTDAEESGPGPVEPVRVESVSSGETFADRAAKRTGSGNKAVQSAENK